MLNLLEYLEDSAARVPEKIAFADENHSFTFVQLLQFARAVGTDIAQRVGRVNRPVAVLADRTAMTPAAFQAVLASGRCKRKRHSRQRVRREVSHWHFPAVY